MFPYVSLHEMSLVPNNTSPHLLNINTGSKYFALFVSLLKHAPLKLILYLFMNQIYEVGPEIWTIYAFFRWNNRAQISVQYVFH